MDDPSGRRLAGMLLLELFFSRELCLLSCFSTCRSKHENNNRTCTRVQRRIRFQIIISSNKVCVVLDTRGRQKARCGGDGAAREDLSLSQ